MLQAMQILIDVDTETAARLEQVAPARSRKRSAFIREAIVRALDALAEQEMATAYRAQPDTAEAPYLDVAAWERENVWRAAEPAPEPLATTRRAGATQKKPARKATAQTKVPAKTPARKPTTKSTRAQPARGRKRP